MSTVTEQQTPAQERETEMTPLNKIAYDATIQNGDPSTRDTPACEPSVYPFIYRYIYI